MTVTLNDIWFLSTNADPYVWYRLEVRTNGCDYNEYILCCDKMDQPKIYLGDKVGKIIVDGAEGWYMYEEKYVGAAVDNV